MTALMLSDYLNEYVAAAIRGSRLVHDDAHLEIYRIENRHAADYWFYRSHWCVKANPWFDDYRKSGPLLLLRSHRRKRDYLLAPAHGEMRNRRNRRVSLARFVADHPSAYLPFRSLGIFWREISDDHDLIMFAPTRSTDAKGRRL